MWQIIAVGVVGICAAVAIVKGDDHVLTFGSRVLPFFNIDVHVLINERLYCECSSMARLKRLRKYRKFCKFEMLSITG